MSFSWGDVQDTSKKSVLKAIEQADLLQEEDESPRSCWRRWAWHSPPPGRLEMWGADGEAGVGGPFLGGTCCLPFLGLELWAQDPQTFPPSHFPFSH